MGKHAGEWPVGASDGLDPPDAISKLVGLGARWAPGCGGV